MSCNHTYNIVVTGLGGQGVLKVTDILAEALFESGFDVKKSEVHGMSQRGGSVSSEVRYGCHVASPMVPAGECDLLAVLEPTQLENVLGNLKKGGILITTDDVPKEQLKHPKAINTMILGAIAANLQVVEMTVWEKCLRDNFPAKLQDLNIEMFKVGFNSVKLG